MAELKNELHERFAVEYFRTNNRTQAALNVGYTGQTAQLHGAKLLQLPKVKARIKELRRLARNDAIATVTERKESLTRIIRQEPFPETINARDRIAAISELNEMDGSYPPQKHAVLGDIIVEVVYKERKKELLGNEPD